jgi:3-deoxy-manno-octulosonate cytidylyltransferase (CMP-KDO synthetase)
MDTIIVIPARYASSRFPAKPLAKIAGVSLLSRVIAIAKAVPKIDAVFVATDSEEIAKHVVASGHDVIMTSEGCRNGSERVWEAVQSLADKPRVVINLQGDAVLMPPWIIGALASEMESDRSVSIATPAARLSREQYLAMAEMKAKGIVSGTTVTFGNSRNALYFSKAIIPFAREWPKDGESPFYQHIGVYAYTYDALKSYVELPMGRLEQVEQLEQLRALENGMPIRVVEVSMKGRTVWSVDNPQDITRVEQIIAREGELV